MNNLFKKILRFFFESEAQLIRRYQYVYETERLTLIKERDGEQAAIAFAKQSMIIYRRHILKVRGWYNQELRKTYIQSYLHFKKVFLEGEL